MRRGPKLNKLSKSFTTRDSLGIESVVSSMQAEICPIVTTVTPRAFYWPFMVWIYYDFYKYSGITEHNISAFDKYLKRQDYFFVLATLLNKGSDEKYLVGKDQSSKDISNNTNGPYYFNPKYFKTTYGGMQYYNSGCLSMYFISNEDVENEKHLSFPALRPEGIKMAKAFEEVIKETEYYKSYRRNDEAVPRDVLEAYGKTIKFNLKGFNECKSQLRHYIFEDDRAIQLKDRSQLMTDCARYLELIVNDNGVKELSLDSFRGIFYDHILPSGKKLKIPDECFVVANKWEIVVARMYFACGIEMFWKFILEQLDEPLYLGEWVSRSFEASDFEWDLDMSLDDALAECVYGFNDIEKMIAQTRGKNTSSYSLENGLRVILSVYNKLQNRDDFGEEKAFLDYGIDTQSISLSEMFSVVDKYKTKTIKEFMKYIIQKWVVEQHFYTASEKMINGRDGFYFEVVNDKYVRRKEFSLDFQGIRMLQLKQIMIDLDML